MRFQHVEERVLAKVGEPKAARPVAGKRRMLETVQCLRPPRGPVVGGHAEDATRTVADRPVRSSGHQHRGDRDEDPRGEDARDPTARRSNPSRRATCQPGNKRSAEEPCKPDPGEEKETEHQPGSSPLPECDVVVTQGMRPDPVGRRREGPDDTRAKDAKRPFGLGPEREDDHKGDGKRDEPTARVAEHQGTETQGGPHRGRPATPCGNLTRSGARSEPDRPWNRDDRNQREDVRKADATGESRRVRRSRQVWENLRGERPGDWHGAAQTDNRGQPGWAAPALTSTRAKSHTHQERRETQQCVVCLDPGKIGSACPKDAERRPHGDSRCPTDEKSARPG